MTRTAFMISCALVSHLMARAPARADEVHGATDDGYCDHVEGAAAAESALLFAPQIYGELGRIEQATGTVQPGLEPAQLRLIAGVRYRISGIYEGVALRGRAKAECARHTALVEIRSETLYRALEARANVLDEALRDADRLLVQVAADLDARRTTTQEATATRLRVDELRRLSAETHQALGGLPRPSGAPARLAAFQRADAEVERRSAQLRRARAFDVSLRAGFDQFLDRTPGDTSSPLFAAVSVGVNVGVLFQGGGNARAAAGRRSYLRAGGDPDAAADRLHALAETAARRAEETAALEADLQRQLDALGKVGGEDSRRYRQVVWFDLVKVRAEHAYHQAQVAALRQVLGGEP
ncbi:MAG: hypothetical protein ACTHU0_19375 [Kofleriaceae bacterium]